MYYRNWLNPLWWPRSPTSFFLKAGETGKWCDCIQFSVTLNSKQLFGDRNGVLVWIPEIKILATPGLLIPKDWKRWTLLLQKTCQLHPSVPFYPSWPLRMYDAPYHSGKSGPSAKAAGSNANLFLNNFINSSSIWHPSQIAKSTTTMMKQTNKNYIPQTK